MTKRILAGALALASTLGLLAALGTAAPAGARPRVPDRPNGVTRQQAQRAAAGSTGDCALAGVTCKPDRGGSCTGNTSQTTAPATIRVYVPSVAGHPYRIQTIPFETYVENVLPDEWTDTWDGDSLKAGAVAVTSYAWYWATHYGGYVDGTPSASTCFDVTDDTNFQKYKANSAQPNSTSKVQQVFPTAIRVGGDVLQASYFSAVRNDYDVTKAATYDACGQGADGTFLSQSGSQTCNEDNTGNKWPVILKTYYGQDIQLASTQQLRTPHDFQYLQRSTRATFHAGAWAIDDGYPTTFSLGRTGDLPVINTAGDGFARIGVFRPSNGTWYLGSPTGTVASSVAFGRSGDTPVAAQYNGLTAPTQLAVFRPSNGTWYLRGGATVAFGRSGDVPVPGRWTSSSADSIAVFRPSNGTWYLRGGATVAFGRAGDIPVPADYNGDGITDIAVFRPSNGTWYVRGGVTAAYGAKGDVPVTGDYTGDGKADLAFYRPSNHGWYVRGGSIVAFGSTGVTPIGAAPYRD